MLSFTSQTKTANSCCRHLEASDSGYLTFSHLLITFRYDSDAEYLLGLS